MFVVRLNPEAVPADGSMTHWQIQARRSSSLRSFLYSALASGVKEPLKLVASELYSVLLMDFLMLEPVTSKPAALHL